MKIFKRTSLVFSILLLNSALYGKGIQKQFDMAIKGGHYENWTTTEKGKEKEYYGVKSILNDEGLLNKALKEKALVDMIGKDLKRAAQRAGSNAAKFKEKRAEYVAIIRDLLNNPRIFTLLQNSEWFKEAQEATKNEEVKTLLQAALDKS